jgi:hypothetical protein
MDSRSLVKIYFTSNGSGSGDVNQTSPMRSPVDGKGGGRVVRPHGFSTKHVSSFIAAH